MATFKTEIEDSMEMPGAESENEGSMDKLEPGEYMDTSMIKTEPGDSMVFKEEGNEESLDIQGEETGDCEKDTEDFIHGLTRCNDAASLIWKSEELLYDRSLVTMENKSLMQLEKILLDMAATPSLCLGLLYILMFKVGDSDVIRFIEAGNYVGFVHKKAEIFGSREVLKPLEVYNQYDINKKKMILKNKPKKSERKRSNKQRFKELLGVAQKHLGIIEPNFKSTGIVKYFFLCTVRESPSADDRFHHCWKEEKMYPDMNTMKDFLHEHIMSGQHFQGKSLHDLSPLPNFEDRPLSPWEQFEHFSKISNYHWCQYTRLDGKKSTATLNVGLIEHLSYSPFPLCADGTVAKVRKYLPVSPRNRMIYFMMNYPVKLPFLVRNVMQEWEKERESFVDETPESPISHKGQGKKRKYKKSFASLTESQIDEKKSEKINTSMFENFEEFLLSSLGTILWRQHSPIHNVFILNDFEMRSGDGMPNSYVHIIVTEGESDWDVQCTCKMYDFLTTDRAKKGEKNQSETCMHCRFVRSNLIGQFNDFEDIQNSSAAVKMKTLSCSGWTPARDQPVVLIGKIYKKGCTKYSVLPPGEQCEFVHINKGVVRCQGKTCVVNCQIKIDLRDLVQGEYGRECLRLCEHLKTLSEYQQFYQELLNEKIVKVNGKKKQKMDLNIEQDQSPSVVDQEFVFISDPEPRTTSSRSTHTPKSMYDPELISATHCRLSMFAHSLQRNKYGHLLIQTQEGQREPLKFYPKPETIHCKCGAGYFTDVSSCHGCDLLTCSCWNNLEGDIACIMYTRYGSVSCEVYKRHCLQRSTGCELLYTGQGHCLHFLSHKTVMGDELGWDFCTEAKFYKMSFGGFCDKMTRQYKTLGTTAAPFMSKGTFMKWFLSWEARLGEGVILGEDLYASNRKKSVKSNRKTLEETINTLKKQANDDLDENIDVY